LKKLVLIFLVPFFFYNSCGKEEPIKDPSFCFNLAVVNSAQPLKLSMDIRPPHASYSEGIIYIHRINGHPASLDYREAGTVRRHMLDSIPLSRETFEKFSMLVRQAGVWEQQDVFGTRTDGNAYQITVSDSLLQHIFSVMGYTENKPLLELIAFCSGQFEIQFPSISIMDINSELIITKKDRVGGKQDSTLTRLTKRDNEIILNRAQTAHTLSGDEYVELWRTLENNRVWDLSSNIEFVSKYPIEYRLEVRRGDLMKEFVVFAPSKLKDKRYFNVINHIEALLAEK
jgi:hypothetical protein